MWACDALNQTVIAKIFRGRNSVYSIYLHL